VADVGEGHG